MIKVLIADDSALMRRSLKKIIESDRKLKVIAAARDGEDAVLKARELQPDVVTMDINMPVLDGISAMQQIVDEKIAPVLMVSSLTKEGAEATFQSMALGAFDYVAKPGGTVSTNMAESAREIIAKIKAAVAARATKKLARSRRRSRGLERRKSVDRRKTHFKRVKCTKSTASNFGYKAVAIGISTGGPKTIFDVLPFLPSDLNAAVFFVQHMPASFTSSYAQRINQETPMNCLETKAGMIVEPGNIYLAAGGKHLTLFKKNNGDIVIRCPSRPDHQFIPSVGVMMDSVLSVYGADTIGVLMTGMGDDGADSMVRIVESGGKTIAESDETAIVFGMPREAIDRGGANIVAASWDIAEEIIKLV